MITSINPATQQKMKDYPHLSSSQLNILLDENHHAYLKWRNASYRDRGKLFLNLANILRERSDELALLITSEMGKILGESKAEIEKCAWICEYYAENTESLLKSEPMTSDASSCYVRFDPLGTVFAIMPWNFPFWQVFRAAVPTMMAGNTFVLRHARNVPGCGEAIEKLFIEAGFPQNCFNNLQIPVELSEEVIAHPAICGITLTGSSRAGRSVASTAGKYLKKCVLELGGSDPYIVLKDGDIYASCTTAVASRMLNAGQVCISAKRFIVEQEIYEEFVQQHRQLLEEIVVGDPINPTSEMGPMARIDLMEQIEQQIDDSIAMGATLVTGGKRIHQDGLYFQPTLLVDVTPNMPVYKEETFGPVSVIIPAKNADDAIRIANETSMGLGASIWTQDMKLAEEMARRIESGAVFINGMTKSDPRIPFGGIKQSGFGRELGSYGIKEFLNIKTVWIK
ncbi:MAG: NAD-dependent succinate-semialdehyde dehydrogenase [Bacteroidales bacterium]|jgi:succinate-semialdehyde dehydrogenase/glutarate-semialdehyde dehydrogenase